MIQAETGLAEKPLLVYRSTSAHGSANFNSFSNQVMHPLSKSNFLEGYDRRYILYI